MGLRPTQGDGKRLGPAQSTYSNDSDLSRDNNRLGFERGSERI